MKTSLKFVLASLTLVANSAFAMTIPQSTIDMFAHATDHFKMGSVDDKLNGLTRLLASDDCGFLNAKAGEKYLLFFLSNDTFTFRANAASSMAADLSLPLATVLGQNGDGSVGEVGGPVGIVDPKTQDLCLFIRQPAQ